MRSNLAVLPARVPTLATRLRREGWKTGAVVSNLVLRERTGLNAGFEHYDANLPDVEAQRARPERTAGPTTDAAIAMLGELLADESARALSLGALSGPARPLHAARCAARPLPRARSAARPEACAS